MQPPEQRPTLTITESGTVLTETHDGIELPADYSFATINDYVHAHGRHFEELQYLALGMACKIDTQQARIAELEGKVEVAQAGYAAAVSKSEWQSRTNGELNQSLSRIAELEQKLAALETWTEEDKPLPEDSDIESAHPLNTGRHDIYAEAVRIVGAKRSKFALISVVNWLMVRADAAEQDAARYRIMRSYFISPDDLPLFKVSILEMLQKINADRGDGAFPTDQEFDSAVDRFYESTK